MQDEIISLVADPHFTNDPRDEHRWDLFPQLKKIHSSRSVTGCVIVGDLTEKKDNHSAQLVNRIVDNLTSLSQDLPSGLILLRGNHDGIDADCPYFRFIRTIPKLEYVERRTALQIGSGKEIAFLPHSRDPLAEWSDFDIKDRICLTHITVDGAFSETGYEMNAEIPSDFFKDTAITFSGDIHKPQQCGPVIYVGCPYNVRFGDNFDGGIILLNTRTLEWERVPLDFPRKVTLDITSVESLKSHLNRMAMEGIDRAFVKIRLHVNHSNMGDRHEIQRQVLDLMSKSSMSVSAFEMPSDLVSKSRLTELAPEKRQFIDFDEFCKRRQIPESLIAVGKSIIQENP